MVKGMSDEAESVSGISENSNTKGDVKDGAR